LSVGVDADAIQLRVFAHYINDSELIEALISGKKEDKSDAHSLNQRILGSVCKTRAAAKRFLYALFLGAGLGKLSTILGCGQEQAKEALGKLMERYSGFDQLKRSTIPRDARNGWFIGLDGRRVGIPGADFSERRHLAMSGYLQNGEAIIMKLARLLWKEQIRLLFPEEYAIKLVNFVHDEWQTEVPNTDYYIAHEVARIQCEAIRKVGEQLKLNCPLAGTYGDNPNDYKTWTFGHNWKETH
jgi:DNA polymerase-1